MSQTDSNFGPPRKTKGRNENKSTEENQVLSFQNIKKCFDKELGIINSKFISKTKHLAKK